MFVALVLMQALQGLQNPDRMHCYSLCVLVVLYFLTTKESLVLCMSLSYSVLVILWFKRT